MKQKETVCAIVVTYNRKNLLIECLAALLAQTRPIDAMYIIDNFSTDKTPEVLLEHGYIKNLPPNKLSEPYEAKVYEINNKIDGKPIKVFYVRMNENTGGAGGFYEGVKRGYKREYDWLWLMDDDTIAKEDALEKLLSKKEDLVSQGYNVGLLCSYVLWLDGTTHKMNMPSLSMINEDVFKITSCSFVSCLISAYAVKEVGLPIKEMFIYADDVEYTWRISKKFDCLFIPKSKVIHKTDKNTSVNPLYISNNSLIRIFYDSRNLTFYHRKRGLIYLLYFLLSYFRINFINTLKRKEKKFKALYLFLKGLIFGLFFFPKIEKIE